MKKIILSAAAVLAFGFANAQEEVKFGAKAGVNFSTLTGDIEGASSLVGFHVGAFAEIPFAEKFAFQPELLYSTQGAKSTFDDGETTFDTETKLGYLNIPLMVKYYVAEKFSLEFGPQVGFLLSAKSSTDFGIDLESAFGDLGSVDGLDDLVSDLGASADIKDSLNSVDFGLNFGAGYDFTDHFTAGARYNLGLSNIYKTDYTDANVKNSVISVSVGYKF